MKTPETRTNARQRTEVVTIALCLAGSLVSGATRGAVAEGEPPPIEKVRISGDGRRFVLAESGTAFVPWGFNYLGEFGQLMEETWDTDWSRVERDFREMRTLGANVVRVHLQFGTYTKGPDDFDQRQLERRWQVQARWWETIARTCAGHPAVFCYDLMNEPIVGEPAKEGEPRWVGGELGGFYFVQRISEASRERTSTQIAEAWAAKLTKAIRRQDPETPITAGVIPWAFVWPNAKPLFYSPEVSKHFDFVSIHAYPEKGKVDQAIAALAAYDIGKPLVVEETFPLNCTIEEMDRFIDGGKDRVEGWISHHFGHTIEEHRRGAEPVGTAPDAPFRVTVAEFLKYWRDKGKIIAGTSPEEADPRSESEAAPTGREP